LDGSQFRAAPMKNAPNSIVFFKQSIPEWSANQK
jgi:hypothetical protein